MSLGFGMQKCSKQFLINFSESPRGMFTIYEGIAEFSFLIVEIEISMFFKNFAAKKNFCGTMKKFHPTNHGPRSHLQSMSPHPTGFHTGVWCSYIRVGEARVAYVICRPLAGHLVEEPQETSPWSPGLLKYSLGRCGFSN